MGLADRTPPTAAEYIQYRERFSNWGRWGDDDEFGTLNNVTPDVRRASAQLVQEGRSISVGRQIDTSAGPANPYPAHHFLAVEASGGTSDYIGMFIHGYSQTHLDALCHLPDASGERFFNGKTLGPARSPMPFGHARIPRDTTGTIDFWRDGIVTRGILLDIPRLRSTERVEPGSPVHGWELEDAAAAQGVEPRPGDAVLIRSGRRGYGPYEATSGESPGFGGRLAGVHVSCIEFLYEHDTALLCWDMLDAPVADQGIPHPLPFPTGMVHHIVLPYMGLPIIDNADFEALAPACSELERWEFQFVVAPLVIRRGTGSPVNPLAIL
jgi:kynurenine formamidase